MKKHITLFALLSIVATTPAYATDLLTVYEQAVHSDPTFQAALATRNANNELVPQGVAALLPTLSGTAGTSDTRNNVPQGNAYNSHSYGLSLTQPVFNLASWMQLRANSATAKAADATYAAALQDLIMRTSTAYFNVLQAQDTLTYTEAQKEALKNQLQQVRDRFDVGMATMTDVYQAQASYDAILATEISAKNNIVNSMASLQQITGQNYDHLATLRDTFPLITPEPNDVTQWTHTAIQQNWTLKAAEYTAQAAHETVRVNFAGNLPTVNIVSSYDNGNNVASAGVAGGLLQRNQWQSNVGVQVNIPIYSGGLVVSQTRQAEDNYAADAAQMQASYRSVVSTTDQTFNNVVAYSSKIAADRLAITSAASALDATNAGYRVGTKTILDVLTAQQNLYQAQTNYATDEYTYITNILALKQAAGTLGINDVQEINNWLEEVAPITTQPVTPTTKKHIHKKHHVKHTSKSEPRA